MNKSIVLTLALLLTLTTASFAQKFGYCNSSALLADLPEVKEADSELKAFQTQLTKRGQDKVKALQDRAAELDRKKKEGQISPKDQEAEQAALQTMQEDIGKYEQEVYANLSEKRETLYKPLLDRVNTAMSDVAKANGFTMVFDMSTQVLLFADESLDVTKLVRAKLQGK